MLDSRAVPTLFRYFIVRYLKFFVAILTILLLTITLVETFVNFERSFTPQGSQLSLWRYLIIRVPSYYLRDLIPVSAFMACLYSLATCVQRSEWTTMQTAGISAGAILRPIMAGGIIVALFLIVLSETWLPQLFSDYSAVREKSVDELTFSDGNIWHANGQDIYRIRSSDIKTRTLKRVVIYQRNQAGRLTSVIRAPLVQVQSDGSWTSKNANIRRFDPEHPEKPAQVDLNVEVKLPGLTETSPFILLSKPQSLTLPQMLEYVTKERSDTRSRLKAKLHRMVMFIHFRLSEFILILLLTLVAVPFALRVTPGGSITQISIWALLTLASLLFLRNLGQELSLEGILGPFAGNWALPLLSASAALLAISRSSRPV